MWCSKCDWKTYVGGTTCLNPDCPLNRAKANQPPSTASAGGAGGVQAELEQLAKAMSDKSKMLADTDQVMQKQHNMLNELMQWRQQVDGVLSTGGANSVDPAQDAEMAAGSDGMAGPAE